MSSGFPGGYSDFFTGGNGRSMLLNNGSSINTNNINPQGVYRSPLAGILSDPSSQMGFRRPDLIGKRSLAEFQQQQQQFQQGIYLRNVKPRPYQQTSPISPLSPMDFSASSISSEVSSISNNSSAASGARYGLPVLQQFRQQNFSLGNGNFNGRHNFSALPLPNLAAKTELVGYETEKKMMNRLQQLEKELLDDIEDGDGDTVSAVTNSEWSETIQNLLGPSQAVKPISPSPASSSSSCSSSSASPPTVCPKQSLTEAATAISDCKSEAAMEILTRLAQVSNARGNSEQRLTAYMATALRSRVNPTEYPPQINELYGKEHMVSSQMLYDKSPCFKLGFMAANLAILEAVSDQAEKTIHVVDFDVGQGGQYVHLLHALSARKTDTTMFLKITTFVDFVNGSEERLKLVGDGLKALAGKMGVSLSFDVLNLKISDLSIKALGVKKDEALAVNLAFKLYKLPDESVTTENLRDELLRRVKSLSPKVVTVVEQEMNGNTAAFAARVTEACGYYGALFDSLDATVPRDNPERVRIEEGLGRKMANSVACEGRDRVERCEVFGKWRARLRMAGFEPKPLSQLVADSLRAKLNSGTRGNPGFTVKEDTGGICFGWMGRTLTVASAWI